MFDTTSEGTISYIFVLTKQNKTRNKTTKKNVHDPCDFTRQQHVFLSCMHTTKTVIRALCVCVGGGRGGGGAWLWFTHLRRVDSSIITLWNGLYPIEGVSSWYLSLPYFIEISIFNATSVDPDETSQFARMSNAIFWKNKKNILKCLLLKCLLLTFYTNFYLQR